MSDGRTRLFGDPQLDLFGRAIEEPQLDLEALGALAARLPKALRFGTSSWTFPGWAGIVYRERYRNEKAFVRESLREYARHPLLRTVGIDRSFYGPLTAKDYQHYASLLPADFRCVQKVWSAISTRVFASGDARGRVNPSFLDLDLLESVLRPLREARFEPHQGPILVCVPPAPGPVNADGFARVVARFLEGAPRDFTFGFELRDVRLLSPQYVDALGAHGGVHVFNYWERMPQLAEQRARIGVLPGPLVVRLMIPPGEQYAKQKALLEPFDRLAAPQPEMRAQTVALIQEFSDLDRDAYVIANNKAEGCSPLTVRAIAESLTRS